jgi:hypothetical protein
VAERLGEVADHPARAGVVLLRQQADVVGEAAEPLEQLAGVVAAAGPGEADTSQKEQARNGCSSPGRPSTPLAVR